MSAADEQVQREMDEALVAVRTWERRNLAIGGVCDFCAHKLVAGQTRTWIISGILTASFSVLDGETLGAGTTTIPYDPFWAACLSCDAEVAKHDPEALATYVLEHRDVERVSPFGLREVPAWVNERIRADLVELYRGFYALDPQRLPT